MQIRNYEVKKKIGVSGVMGVYEGVRTADNLLLTVNILLKQHISDDSIKRRLKREFNSAKAVDSPYVIKYMDLIETDEIFAVVTESLPSMTLKAVLALASATSIENSIQIIKQIALGLQACHCAGVVHRNVTPENIYIDGENKIKIANFGLATMLNATTLTMTGTMTGSPEYAPPENMYSAPKDIRGDIYSLGIILWEMLTGENPFEGQSITEIIHSKQEAQLPKASGVNPEVPPWMDILIKDMTSPNPNERLSSLNLVIVALEQQKHLKHQSGSASGNCFTCGYPLIQPLSFCPYCGKSIFGDKKNDDKSVILLTSIKDSAATAAFLKQSFVTDQPVEKLASMLNKPLIPVVENVSADESLWIVDSLNKLGCSTELRPMPAWFYKVSAFIIFCIFLIYCVFMVIRPVSPDPLMQQETPVFVSTVYLWVKLITILIILGILIWHLRLHYAPLLKIPVEFVKGALQFNPFSKFITLKLRIINFIIVIAGTFIIIWLVPINIAFDISMLAKQITDPYWIVTMSGDPVDRPFGDQEEQRNIYLSLWLIRIGELIILKIIVGRIYFPPLFGRAGNKKHDARDRLQLTDHTLLEKLRSLAIDNSNRDFRYLLAGGMEHYLTFIRLKDKSLISKTDISRHLQEQLLHALETVAGLGAQLKDFIADASEETKQRADDKLRRIKQHLSQVIGEPHKSLMDEWRKAQDMMLRYETAVDILADQLNKLRLVVGGMQAVTLQLAAASGHGKSMDDSGIQYGIAMLSETIKIVSP